MISHYLIDIIILLLTAVIAVPFFQTIRLGAVPGFLISGVIVGPSGLGLIGKVSEISHLAEIGVVLLLFIIGIELKPSRLWLMRRLVFGLGALQVIITGTLIAAIAHLLFSIPLRTSILIGPALALSSTAFVLQLLIEKKALNTSYGRSSFSILLFQDLAVVPLLALVPLLSSPDLTVSEDIGYALAESIIILSLLITVGRYLLNPLLHRVAVSRNSEVFTASAVLIVLGTALITEYIGLSMAMGAFLAGLLISDSSYRHQVTAEIQPFRGLFLGLFFMSMGMSLNIQLLLNEPLLSLLIVVLLISIKVIVLFPICYLFKIELKNSLAIALILAQSGEFALVLFSLAFQSQMMDETLFQQLLLTALLSMLLTPLLAHLAQRIIRHKTPTTRLSHKQEDYADASIFIAGFGRVGRRIGEILADAEIPYLAFDSDAETVKYQRSKGHRVYYGDVSNPHFMKYEGAHNASLFIVTINDPKTTERMVKSLHQHYPDIPIFARGHNKEQSAELRKIGASAAVSENIEASLELARLTLNNLRFDVKKQDQLLKNYRRNYYQQIEKEIKKTEQS